MSKVYYLLSSSKYRALEVNFLSAKNKNHQIGEALNLKLLDYPWTPGTQYLLPRISNKYVTQVMFHIKYKIVALNTKL